MEIRDKYKKLELLVDQLILKVKEKEEENGILLSKIKMLESKNRLNESAQDTVNALTEWKDMTTVVLEKLYRKIDKEIVRIESQIATPKIDK